MSDAALEEVMDWLVERSAERRDVALRYGGGGHWTGEVWEVIDGRPQRNCPGGGPNALSAAVSTFVRISGRTEPELTGAEVQAQVADLMQRHGLVRDSEGRIVEEAAADGHDAAIGS